MSARKEQYSQTLCTRESLGKIKNLSDAPALLTDTHVIHQGCGQGFGMRETFSGGSNVGASLETRYFPLEACAQGLCPSSPHRWSGHRRGFREKQRLTMIEEMWGGGIRRLCLSPVPGWSVLNSGVHYRGRTLVCNIIPCPCCSRSHHSPLHAINSPL